MGKIFIPVTEITVTRPARPLIWTHWYCYEEKSGEASEISETEPAWLTGLIWRGPGKWICTLRERVGEVQEKSNTTLRRSRRTRKRIHLNEFVYYGGWLGGITKLFKVSSSVPSSTFLFQKIFRFLGIVFIRIQSVLIIIKAKVVIQIYIAYLLCLT